MVEIFGGVLAGTLIGDLLGTPGDDSGIEFPNDVNDLPNDSCDFCCIGNN